MKQGPILFARGWQKADASLMAELKNEDTNALRGGNRKTGRRRTGKGILKGIKVEGS